MANHAVGLDLEPDAADGGPRRQTLWDFPKSGASLGCRLHSHSVAQRESCPDRIFGKDRLSAKVFGWRVGLETTAAVTAV